VSSNYEELGPVVDENAFRPWYAERAARLGLNPNPDDPKHFYDYRSAFAAGRSRTRPATGRRPTSARAIRA
jgi:hypothetical protein